VKTHLSVIIRASGVSWDACYRNFRFGTPESQVVTASDVDLLPAVGGMLLDDRLVVGLQKAVIRIRDRCYDFFFAEKFSEKIGVFDSKQR
jgi:hypothetical protein